MLRIQGKEEEEDTAADLVQLLGMTINSGESRVSHLHLLREVLDPSRMVGSQGDRRLSLVVGDREETAVLQAVIR